MEFFHIKLLYSWCVSWNIKSSSNLSILFFNCLLKSPVVYPYIFAKSPSSLKQLYCLLYKDMFIYYNQIDIGIFLCFLELTLQNNNISYTRQLFIEQDDNKENNLVANYTIKE